MIKLGLFHFSELALHLAIYWKSIAQNRIELVLMENDGQSRIEWIFCSELFTLSHLENCGQRRKFCDYIECVCFFQNGELFCVSFCLLKRRLPHEALHLWLSIIQCRSVCYVNVYFVCLVKITQRKFRNVFVWICGIVFCVGWLVRLFVVHYFDFNPLDMTSLFIYIILYPIFIFIFFVVVSYCKTAVFQHKTGFIVNPMNQPQQVSRPTIDNLVRL